LIPHEMLEEVTAKVIEWSRIESGSRADIVAGMPLLEALEKYGHL